MPHEILGNRFLSYRQIPWHGLGTVLTDPIDASSALNQIGTVPVYLETIQTASGVPLNQQAILRGPIPEDPRTVVFGTVGLNYTLITPEAVCDAWDQAVSAPLETIGFLKHGSSLFLTTKLPSFSINGDDVEMYCLVSSPMTGAESLQIRVTPVRVVCWNTLTAAKSASQETYRIIHDRTAETRLREWLKDLMERVHARAKILEETFRGMATTPISSAGVRRILESVYPEPKAMRRDAPDTALERRQEIWESNRKWALRRRDQVREALDVGLGSQLESAKGTVWGVYNAITEVEDYAGKGQSSQRMLEARQFDSLFGFRADFKERAYVEAIREIQSPTLDSIPKKTAKTSTPRAKKDPSTPSSSTKRTKRTKAQAQISLENE